MVVAAFVGVGPRTNAFMPRLPGQPKKHRYLDGRSLARSVGRLREEFAGAEEEEEEGRIIIIIPE